MSILLTHCARCETEVGTPIMCDCFDSFCLHCYTRHECEHHKPTTFPTGGRSAPPRRERQAFTPRVYQRDAIEGIFEQFQNNRRTLAVLPTGCGKTIIFAHVAHRWTQGRVLMVAHRDELIRQGAHKIEQVTGEPCDIEMASQYADRQNLHNKSKVVVTSVQTQNSGPKCKECGPEPCGKCIDGMYRRMMRFDPFEFGLVIVDEAHHGVAKSYKRVIDYFSQNPECKVLGVTATPDRCDEAALGQIFESVAFEYGILDAINDGWLVPVTQQFVYVEDLDFSTVGTVGGDLNQGHLAQLMERDEILYRMVVPAVELVGKRKTLFFTVSVEQAEHGCEIANAIRPGKANWICGTTPIDKRRELLAAYSRGEFQFLFNVGIATEGFDDPGIEAVVIGRPTKSRALYTQMVGRGTRPLTGVVDGLEVAEDRLSAIKASAKPDVLILDFVGNSGKHKLVCTADILGGNYDDQVVERAKKKVKDKGNPEDILEALDEAEKELTAERQKWRKQLSAQAKFGTKNVNPFDVFDIMPGREPGWHKGRKPSAKQIAMLEKAGVKDADRLSFVNASKLIGEIIKRRNDGLCSYKQARLLAKYGHDTNVGFKEASEIIDRIAKNGWRGL